MTKLQAKSEKFLLDWEVDVCGRDGSEKDPRYFVVLAEGHRGQPIVVLDTLNSDHTLAPEDKSAIANLAGAAPAMLALLIDLYNHGYTTGADHDRVRATIAKAMGEEHRHDCRCEEFEYKHADCVRAGKCAFADHPPAD